MDYNKLTIFQNISITILSVKVDSIELRIDTPESDEIFKINIDEFYMLWMYLDEIKKSSRISYTQNSDHLSHIEGEASKAYSQIIWSLDSQDFFQHGSFLKKTVRGNKTRDAADVFIALPQKNIELSVIEDIQNAAGDFMEALGYEMEQKEEPVIGSFFQKIKFLLNSDKTRKEVNDAYEKGKLALELNYLNMPNAEVTEKLANSAANLISALNGIDEGALRLGAILVVKRLNHMGNTDIIAETLSPELTMLFDKNPQLLSNPSNVFNLLESVKKDKNYFLEGDGVNMEI